MCVRDDEDQWAPEDEWEEAEEPVRFEDRVTECPNCKKPITDEMDSCPYCGDILFRYLKDGIFVPRKGPLAKMVAILVLVIILLGVIAFLLGTLRLY
jgi:hypothetical protein